MPPLFFPTQTPPEIEIERFGAGEQRLSSRRFNQLRAAFKSPSFPTFWDWRKHNENLTSYNLSSARHSGGRFVNVIFGSLSDAEFSGCKFENCRFASSRDSYPDRGAEAIEASIYRTVFFECEFAGTDFSSLHLSDVQLVGCTFLSPPRFADARATGRLEIVRSGDQTTFIYLPELDLRLDPATSFYSDIIVNPTLLFDWFSIGFLRRIPFLQISSIGLTLLTVNVAAIQYLIEAVQSVRTRCLNSVAFLKIDHPSMAAFSEAICRHINGDAMFASLVNGFYLSSILFVSIFLASLVQIIKSPGIVYEYTINQWRVENRYPRLFYQLSCQRNHYWMLLSLALYIFGGVIFLWIFVMKLVSVWTA